jgi:hypothetical protein
MGPKRKRPPSGVVILTTGRTDQIAHDLVLAIFGFGSNSEVVLLERRVRSALRSRRREATVHVSNVPEAVISSQTSACLPPCWPTQVESHSPV